MIFELRAKGDVIVLMLCADCSLFCKMMSSYDIIRIETLPQSFASSENTEEIEFVYQDWHG